MTSEPPPGDPAVTASTSPWTVRNCITASCTRCGTEPLDEDTGLTPHFTSPAQAGEELDQEWGWRCTARSSRPEDDELLCPACAQAEDTSVSRPAVTDGSGQAPDTAPSGQKTGRCYAPGFQSTPVSTRSGARGKEADPDAEADGGIAY